MGWLDAQLNKNIKNIYVNVNDFKDPKSIFPINMKPYNALERENSRTVEGCGLLIS